MSRLFHGCCQNLEKSENKGDNYEPHGCLHEACGTAQADGKADGGEAKEMRREEDEMEKGDEKNFTRSATKSVCV